MFKHILLTTDSSPLSRLAFFVAGVVRWAGASSGGPGSVDSVNLLGVQFRFAQQGPEHVADGHHTQQVSAVADHRQAVNIGKEHLA